MSDPKIEQTMTVDRRELMRRAALALGGAVSAGTMLGVMSGCAAIPPPTLASEAVPLKEGRYLSGVELAIASAMADQILPRTATPGAVDVGVPAFIDRLLADFHPERERKILRDGLARADRDARMAGAASFTALKPEQMVALMQVYDQEAVEQSRRTAGDPDPPPHFFRMMKEMTTVGFFTSEVGATQVLKYLAVPGEWKADIPYSEVGRTWAL